MADSESPGEASGKHLGKYELLRHVASGGMAEIHLARVTGIEGFEKIVVLKRVLPQFAGNAEMVKLFLDEARLAANLSHANIAQVYDIGVEAGQYFFAMEFVHGQDVRAILSAARAQGRPLLLADAVGIVLSVCSALHYAHELSGPDGAPLGIIHRDVSPSNILVTYDGTVKLVDFGIARATTRSVETSTGAVRGKVMYMSPEQCRAEPLDRRSDIFAAGIVLYELVTGQRPFMGDSDFAVAQRIVAVELTPPSQLAPGMPAELERIMLRALARDPAQRYPTAQTMQLDLEAFAREARLAVSQVSLGRYLEGLFPRKIEAWRQAQRQGTSLGRHLAQSISSEQIPKQELPTRTLPPPSALTVALPPALGGKAAPVGPTGSRRALPAVVAALALAAASVLGATWFLRSRPTEHAAVATVVVLVADFQNQTGEGVFDGTLEPALALSLEGASFITSYNRNAALKIANQLKLAGTGLSEERARLVSQREGVGVVTSGIVAKGSAGYRISLRAIDAVNGRVLVEQGEDVSDKEQVLGAVTKLAARVRTALGDATPESVQLAAAETYSAASLEAAHQYALARIAQSAGNWVEGQKYLLEAVRLDPNMGRAYSGLAVAENNMGHREKAVNYFNEMLKHVDRMTDREKFRSRGVWYLFQHDPDKAIEALSALVKEYPSDNAGWANLAVGYQFKRDFAKAREAGKRAVDVFPNNTPQRVNLGYYEIFGSDYDAAIADCRAGVGQNPDYVLGWVGIALAQQAAGRFDEGRATWAELAAHPGGAALADEGLADLAVYEGRLTEAAALLDKTIAAARADKDPDAAARREAFLAEVRLKQGKKAEAVALAQSAAKGTEVEYVRFMAGAVLAEAGEDAQAEEIARALDAALPSESRMMAELLWGTLALQHGRYADAVERFKSAGQRVDAWLPRFMLGRAYVEAGNFGGAQDELEKCEHRRGEVTDLFLDNVPTFRRFAPVGYWLARAQEGQQAPAAADSYSAFLKGKVGDEDPLVKAARTRVAAHP